VRPLQLSHLDMCGDDKCFVDARSEDGSGCSVIKVR
jgi:hypothetical protein